MKITKMILTAIVMLGIVVLFNPISAQTTGHGVNFVDLNGDGYNDNAPDHDGDGIPNGMDDDYTSRHGGRGFVDADGDGINDLIQNYDQTKLQNRNRHGENTGDGIPNGMDSDFVKGSGSGNGLQNNGAQMGGHGSRDGTGNRHGSGKR